jgi:hypothetical protein
VESGSIDFSDVDYIKYTFDASGYTSVDYSIGPFITDGDDVPLSRTPGDP